MQGKKLENIYDLNSHHSALYLDASRLFAAAFNNSRQKFKCRRWNSEEKVLAPSLMKCSPKSYNLLKTLSLLPFLQILQCVCFEFLLKNLQYEMNHMFLIMSLIFLVIVIMVVVHIVNMTVYFRLKIIEQSISLVAEIIEFGIRCYI